MTLFGKIRIILALMICCTAIVSNAQSWTSEAAREEMTRCSKLSGLADSNFADLRQRHLLTQRLNEAQVYFDIDKLSDSAIKVEMLNNEAKIVRSVLKTFPRYVYAWLQLGSILYKTGKKNAGGAIVCYNKAIKYSTEPNVDANYNIGCVMIEAGKNKGARNQFLKAYAIDSTNARCTYNLAIAYKNLNKYELAIKWYRRTMELKPDDASACYNIGVLYGKQLHHLDSAIVYISQALTVDSTKELYYEDLAVAYGFNGRYDDAIAVSKKCLEIFPDYIPALKNLVVSYWKKGDEATAKEYEEIIKEKGAKGK